MMETEADKPRRRKAWTYQTEPMPGFADLFAGGDRRKKFVNHWVKGSIVNTVNLALHYGLKLLPLDTCSDFGARMGRKYKPRLAPVAERRARQTLATLVPEKTEAEREEIYLTNCESVGRLLTEYSIVNAMPKHPDRMVVKNFEVITAAASNGPIILVGMHLSNWELATHVFVSRGVHLITGYMPPVGRLKTWIAQHVRTKAGLRFIPPGRQGTRAMVEVLNGGGVLSLLCDEGFAGKIRGPLFGRKPHLEGNIALAVRLARKTNAVLCPWYVTRTDRFHFEFHAVDPIVLPPEDKPGARLLDDIALLNGAIEPAIRAHLDQWYFLDHAIQPD